MSGKHRGPNAKLPPFPYFGGKRAVVGDVWARLGEPKQYIEPFCGSAAMLLGKPGGPAPLEVIGDLNGFIANFWRAVKYQPEAVVSWVDYPVSHIDQAARHQWLMSQRERLGEDLQDADWPGDAKVAGWWLYGQCSWIGSGWADWDKPGNAGQGVQARGKIPHVSDAGRGVQARGKIPHVSDAGSRLLTSAGATAWVWLRALSDRLERTRVLHADWSRCLNHHYGKTSKPSRVAVFLDPPYDKFGHIYSAEADDLPSLVGWCSEHEDLSIALCGHFGDYNLPGWDVVRWSRPRLTYAGKKTKNQEAIYFSPGCGK